MLTFLPLPWIFTIFWQRKRERENSAQKLAWFNFALTSPFCPSSPFLFSLIIFYSLNPLITVLISMMEENGTIIYVMRGKLKRDQPEFAFLCGSTILTSVVEYSVFAQLLSPPCLLTTKRFFPVISVQVLSSQRPFPHPPPSPPPSIRFSDSSYRTFVPLIFASPKTDK